MSKVEEIKKFQYEFLHLDVDGGEVMVRFDADTYGELVERFRLFSLSCGFSPETVEKYLDVE